MQHRQTHHSRQKNESNRNIAKNILVLPADKGNETTILDKSDYREKMAKRPTNWLQETLQNSQEPKSQRPMELKKAKITVELYKQTKPIDGPVFRN